MTTDAKQPFSPLEHLTQRIPDPDAYVVTIRGKPLKQEFRRLVASTLEGDELWEWEWFGTVGVRNAYSMGWCAVRNGTLVASYCHSQG